MSRLSAALLAVAYTALAVLVAIGDFTRVDQWAVNHLMPASEVHRAKPGWLEAAVPLLHQRWDAPLALAADIVTLPAGALVSLAIVVLASRVLGIALLAAWAAGAAIELLCKYTLVRPALYSGTYHLGAFDSSFPSGHALRTVIVAGAVAAVWPGMRLWVGAWALSSVVLLQLAGWHTPTDLAGGLLVGALALLGARAAGALRAGGLPARP